MNAHHSSLRTGAIGALLDEYEKALTELKAVIADVTDAELLTVVDATTSDDNCRSIQTILAHMVRAGYTYAILLDSLKGPQAPFRNKRFHKTLQPFIADLDVMFAFTEGVLAKFKDEELEQNEVSKKMLTPWGQVYDGDQLLEHAIVHILRHRRQLQGFLRKLRGGATA